MEMRWDHDHSLLQISGSLYRYYGMDRGHGSDADLDRWLEEHQPRCVITILIDALGTGILERHLPADSFLRRHLMKSVSTVFPPTTAAATTAFMSGYSPAETGWLGWHQYLREKEDDLILFLNRGYYSGTVYEEDFCLQTLPAERIFDALSNSGIRADSLWPSWSKINPCGSFDELLAKSAELAESNRFLYVYWDELDTLMHQFGTEDERITREILMYEDRLQAFTEQLKEDTAVLVIADHGQINVRHHDLSRDHELVSLLKREPAIEPRTLAFYVKDGCHERFAELFQKRFHDDFVLLEAEEVIRQKLFGPGVPHPRLREFIGDYLAIGISDLQIDLPSLRKEKGNHAGWCTEERMIPLIAWSGR